MDGTLLEAWAGVKSFQRKDGKNPPPPDDPGNPTVNFHGEKRSNQTHASKTDPDAKLARKGAGKEAKLSYSGNLLVENRNGLIVNAEVFEANGTAERDAALVMLEQIAGTKRVTVGGDKGYDTADFVAECRHMRSHAPRGAERRAARRQCHRCADHASRRLCHQPTKEEADRRMFRLAEDDCAAAEGTTSRDVQGGLGVHLRLCRIQPGADAEPEPSGGSTWVSRGEQAPRPTLKTQTHKQAAERNRKCITNINFSAAC